MIAVISFTLIMESILTNKSIYFSKLNINKDIDIAYKHNPSFDAESPIKLNLQKFDIGYSIIPNHHDYFEIAYIMEGKGKLSVEDKIYNTKNDDIIVLSDYETHTLSTYKNETFYVISLCFMPELIYKPGDLNLDQDLLKPFFYRSAGFQNVIYPEKIDHKYIFIQLENIYKTILKKERYFRIELKIYLTNILFKLLVYYDDSGTKFTYDYSKKVYDIKRLNNLLSLLKNEYYKDITLNAAARITNMSTNYFCTFFKKVMKQSFTNYLSIIRIDKAKELLLKDDTQITTIAYKVGFKNLSYFYRKFHEFTNYSPKEYLLKVRQKL